LLHDECLNIHWFETIAEALQLIEACRIQCNESCPHMVLGNKSLAEYLLLASYSPQAQS
jgi:putative transposase